MNSNFFLKRVAVLLSTYNGGHYIHDQLISLLNQNCNLRIDIHIRDDGSTDETLKIIERFLDGNSNIYLHKGRNVGVISSFLWLVDNVAGYDYYAFCDQDDVWEPLKIAAAIGKFSEINKETPQLYCSAFEYVDQDLRPIDHFTSKTDLSINNLLIENCAPGCTIVFNAALRDTYSKLDLNNIAKRIVMHDWFFLLLARCNGEVLYDKNSYLLYRQHSNNVVGIKSGFVSIVKNRWAQFKKERARVNHLLFLQISLLKEICDVSPSSKTARLVINSFVNSQRSFYSRLKYLFMNDAVRVKRIKIADALLFNILYLFGYYK